MDEHSRRRDVWGDDPEEVDASEIVAELEVVEPEAARRWHEHPAFVPFKVVARFIQRSGKRIAVTVAGGFAVLLAGIALLVLPGPGMAADLHRPHDPRHRVHVGGTSADGRPSSKAEQAKDIVLRKKTKTIRPST